MSQSILPNALPASDTKSPSYRVLLFSSGSEADGARDALQERLAQAGCQTRRARIISAAETRSQATSYQPDIIIVETAGMDATGASFEVVRWLHNDAETFAFPIAFVFQKESRLLRESALKVGADDYFPASITPMEMRARLDALRWRVEAGRRAAPVIGEKTVEIENFLLLLDTVRDDIAQLMRGALALIESIAPHKNGSPVAPRSERAMETLYGFLKLNLRRLDAIGFYGPTTLLVYLPRRTKRETVATLSSLREEFLENYEHLNCDLAIGISSFPEDGNDVETVIWHAERSLNRARYSTDARQRICAANQETPPDEQAIDGSEAVSSIARDSIEANPQTEAQVETAQTVTEGARIENETSTESPASLQAASDQSADEVLTTANETSQTSSVADFTETIDVQTSEETASPIADSPAFAAPPEITETPTVDEKSAPLESTVGALENQATEQSQLTESVEISVISDNVGEQTSVVEVATETFSEPAPLSVATSEKEPSSDAIEQDAANDVASAAIALSSKAIEILSSEVAAETTPSDHATASAPAEIVAATIENQPREVEPEVKLETSVELSEILNSPETIESAISSAPTESAIAPSPAEEDLPSEQAARPQSAASESAPSNGAHAQASTDPFASAMPEIQDAQASPSGLSTEPPVASKRSAPASKTITVARPKTGEGARGTRTGRAPHRLLLVASDQSRMAQLNLLMRAGGFEARPAFDGLQGLNLLRIERPDVLIVDYALQGPNGFDIINQLWRQSGGRLPMPVMLLLPAPRNENETQMMAMVRRAAHGLGVQAVVGDPFDAEELIECVRVIGTVE